MFNKKNFKYLLPSIVFFFFTIVFFLYTLFLNYSQNEDSIIVESILDSGFILLLNFLMSFPGFILHFRYEMLNKNKKVTFKQNHLEVENDSKIITVLFSDILQIENHCSLWKMRNLWSEYEYTKLVLNNGQVLFFNCLTAKINSDYSFLKNDRIKKITVEDIFPWY